LNIKLTVSFLGKDYLGFQKSPHGKTIEKELEKALFQVLQAPVYLQASSRLDAGVSAKGLIVTFFLDKHVDLNKLKRSLNGLLPKDISIENIECVNAFFHPSLDSVSKTYLYRICNTTVQSPFLRDISWHYPYKKMDLNLLKESAKSFIGKMDFSAFTPDDYENAICKIDSIEIFEENGHFQISITGNRFLYKMVRTIVGTLVNLSTGTIALSEVEKILEKRQRKQAGLTAPSCGLCLEKVFYENKAYALH